MRYLDGENVTFFKAWSFCIFVPKYGVSTELVRKKCQFSGLKIGDVVLEQIEADEKRHRKTDSSKYPQNSSSRNKMVKPPVQKSRLASSEDIFSLFPDLDKGLRCGLCPYKATQRGNLKTHYKLKHLGGADLKVQCSLCQQVFSTKGNLKKHLINLHNLPLSDATKLLM